MISDRTFAAGIVVFGTGALVHAVLTWPLGATVAFFGGGALLAFVSEAVVINVGWLEHHIGPKLLGVPLYVLFGWVAVVYVSIRLTLLVTTGWAVVPVTAVIATAYDVLTDHQAVAEGRWTYDPAVPGPRFREVPWLNFVGWLAISAVIAAGTIQFL